MSQLPEDHAAVRNAAKDAGECKRMDQNDIVDGAHQRVGFDNFVLDRTDERLLGPNGAIRIGNKAFRVLDALIRRGGLLLTKDELFKTIWDGTFVSESALTSVIKELRRAMGDSSRNPRIIESVYGRGYRMIVPVRNDSVSQLADPTNSVPTAATNPADPAETDKPGRRRSRVEAAKPSLGGHTTLAIMPFSNRSGDNAGEELLEALNEELSAAFSRDWHYRVLSARITAQVERTGQDLKSFIDEHGIDYLIDGKLARYGEKLRVTVELVNARDGAILRVETLDCLDGDAQTPDDLVTQIRTQIGGGLVRSELEEAEGFDEPGNSWRSILRSTILLARARYSAIEKAVEHSRKASQLAPDDPLPMSHLGIALGRLYQRGGSLQKHILTEALNCVAMALQNGSQHHLVVAYASFVKYYAQDWESSLRLAERAYEIEPNSVTTMNCLAGAFIREERYEEAQALLDQIESTEPLSIETIFCLINRCWGFYGMGRIEDAMEAATRMLKLVPSDHASLMMRPVLYAELGDQNRARSCMLELRQCYPEEPLELYLSTIRHARMADHVRDRNAEIFERLWDAFIRVEAVQAFR